MTAADWPRVEPGLEQAYRRLLRAYPRPYRRRHGSEIVTTLLEMAEPGQRRPGIAEMRHLVASGIRQRFRLPAGRPLVWVAAVFALLIGGGVGAAAGSWTAEQTFADYPDRAALTALQHTAVGAAASGGEPPPYWAAGSPWWGVRGFQTTEVEGLTGWDPVAARERLIAEGWQTGPVKRLEGGSASTTDESGQMVELRMDGHAVRAERDGLSIEVSGWLTEMTGSVTTEVGPTGNAGLLPLIAVGGLAGTVAGWLFAAAAGQRLRTSGPARRRVATGLGVGIVLTVALPVLAFYGNVVRAFEHAGSQGPVFTVHSALHVGPYWPWQPEWLNAALAGAGLAALAALVIVVWARRRPAATDTGPVVAPSGPIGAGTGGSRPTPS